MKECVGNNRTRKEGRDGGLGNEKGRRYLLRLFDGGERGAKTYIAVFLSILAVSIAVLQVGARSGGIYDKAHKGCTCHSLSPDPTVSVTMDGLPDNYTPGQTYLLTLGVSGGPATDLGGFNLEVISGTLSTTDPNVQLNGARDQATHTNKGQRSWKVNWTAPGPGEGDVDLYLAGNAVNGNGNNGGDGWNMAMWTVSEEGEDTVPPVVSVTSPSEGDDLSEEEIDVTGTASDNEGLEIVEVKVNDGGWQTADGTDLWSIRVFLTSGANTIRARAKDSSDNEATDIVNVTYSPPDVTPPAISVSSPTEGEIFYTDGITVSGTASDDEGLDRVEVRVNGGSWQLTTGTEIWSLDITLTDGVNTIDARASDTSDNEALDIVNVTYDSSGPPDETSPEIEISWPAEGQVFETETITVEGNATDNADLAKVEIRINDGSWKLADGKGSWNAEAILADGNNMISARATDSSGNTGLASVNVTYSPADTLPPVVIITRPLDGEVVETPVLFVEGNVTDDEGVSKVEVGVNAGNWTAADGTVEWTAEIVLTPGGNEVFAKAEDTSGNVGTASVNVTYSPPDVNPPDISFVWPADDEVVGASPVTVNGTASDDSELDRVEVKVNDGEWKEARGTLNWSSEISLKEGGNTVRARAWDASGNNATVSIKVVLEKEGATEGNGELDGVITIGEYEFEASFGGGILRLYWRVEGNVIRMALQGKTSGWVAVGFDPDKRMDYADMIFGWVTEEGEVVVMDLYSEGEEGPHPPDVSKGGTSDILSYGGRQDPGVTIIEFTRLLITGDEYDKDIDPEGELKIIWAVGSTDDPLEKHSDKGTTTLNIATGEYRGEESPLLWPYHAVLMGTAFLLLAGGATVARFMRKKRWWLKLHKTLGIAGAAMAVAGITFAFYMVSASGGGHLGVLHAYLGVLTALFILTTPVLGYLQLKVKKRKKLIRNTHRWLGRATLILMFFTILGGMLQAGII